MVIVDKVESNCLVLNGIVCASYIVGKEVVRVVKRWLELNRAGRLSWGAL